MNRHIVIDASVFLRVALRESTAVSKKLDTLLRTKPKIISTHLLNLEVANTARFKAKNQSDMQGILHDFFKLQIDLVALSKSQILEIAKQAREINATVYDVCYHYLAMTYNTVLITCDKDYYAKAHYLGHIELWN